MNVRLQCFFACKVIAIAALFSQPLAADDRWWLEDQEVEFLCPFSTRDEIESVCKAGEVLSRIPTEEVPYLCDYRYSIYERSDYIGRASCIYSGRHRISRSLPSSKPD